MKIKVTARNSNPMLFRGMIESISHLRRSGETRAKRLPAVIERKLARCQWSSGRICLSSQTNSTGSRRRSSRSPWDSRRCVIDDNVRPSECQFEQNQIEPRSAHIICPENPCFVRLPINSRRFPWKRIQSRADRLQNCVRKTIREPAYLSRPEDC
jgi:hypothetical protein